MRHPARTRELTKNFLWPWNTLIGGRLTTTIKSVFFGGAVSLSLLIAGCALLLPSQKLNDRGALSVLVNPDFRIIQESQKGKWAIVGRCEMWSSFRPMDESPTLGRQSLVCKGWYLSRENVWYAPKYDITPALPRITDGASRSEAIAYLIGLPISVLKFAFIPFIIFLVVQVGIASGYSRFKKNSHVAE